MNTNMTDKKNSGKGFWNALKRKVKQEIRKQSRTVDPKDFERRLKIGSLFIGMGYAKTCDAGDKPPPHPELKTEKIEVDHSEYKHRKMGGFKIAYSTHRKEEKSSTDETGGD